MGKELFRVGIDTGGTFTDLVVMDSKGKLSTYKSPSTPPSFEEGILNVIELGSRSLVLSVAEFLQRVEFFAIHGSTVATNAVIQWRTAKIGIICTAGHSSILYRGEGGKENPFDLDTVYRRPLVPPHLCREVRERISSFGEVLVPLNEDDVLEAIRLFKKWDVKSIGICLLWSVANPVHEKRVKEIIQREWPDIPVSVSSELQPIIGEYHRKSCTALNATLMPIMKRYMLSLKKRLKDVGFARDIAFVVSSGGLMMSDDAVEKCVLSLFSGPSMGPVAGKMASKFMGGKESDNISTNNVITIDMGGTSFDVGTIVENEITMTQEAKVGEYPTGVVSVDINTLGAGGGSFAWVDQGGMIRVGPFSAEAIPGPACYGKGGKNCTVTDANVVLGYLDPDNFCGGDIKIYPELAEEAIRKFADTAKLEVIDAAMGIYRIVNENMISGILDMTVRKGIDPREFIILAGGGATALHVVAIAKELGIKKVIVPKTAPALCAMGMLAADIIFSHVATKITDSINFDYEAVNPVLENLEKIGKKELTSQGIPLENWKFIYYVGVRYPLQASTLSIPFQGFPINVDLLQRLVDDFHDTHEKRFGTCNRKEWVEFTDWRVESKGLLPKREPERFQFTGKNANIALKGKRRAYFHGLGFIDTPYYHGDLLECGMEIDGPAIIDDKYTTTLVISGWRAKISDTKSYILEDIGNP